MKNGRWITETGSSTYLSEAVAIWLRDLRGEFSSAAPGGVTEMALTAQFLGYDVALITSFQIVRICILMPGIHWFIAAARRFETRRTT